MIIWGAYLLALPGDLEIKREHTKVRIKSEPGQDRNICVSLPSRHGNPRVTLSRQGEIAPLWNKAHQHAALSQVKETAGLLTSFPDPERPGKIHLLYVLASGSPTRVRIDRKFHFSYFCVLWCFVDDSPSSVHELKFNEFIFMYNHFIS